MEILERGKKSPEVISVCSLQQISKPLPGGGSGGLFCYLAWSYNFFYLWHQPAPPAQAANSFWCCSAFSHHPADMPLHWPAGPTAIAVLHSSAQAPTPPAALQHCLPLLLTTCTSSTSRGSVAVSMWKVTLLLWPSLCVSVFYLTLCKKTLIAWESLINPNDFIHDFLLILNQLSCLLTCRMTNPLNQSIFLEELLRKLCKSQ